ncbi:MAG: hypothetical protein ACFFB0_12305 [Promethearchaeota archaeon]
MFGIKYPLSSEPIGSFHTEQIATGGSEVGGLGELVHIGLLGKNLISVMTLFHLYRTFIQSHDFLEGPRAFSENRKPIWKGI